MVYYFTSNVVSPSAFIYVGKDKVENEELIKYGFDEDVWFHVDNLSSAHIYVRLPEGQSWDSIPQELLVDCAQLTKANSIEGNKKDNVTIIYTPWSNLKKDGSMAVGQVGFKNDKKVKKIHVAQRENPIVNRLNKTKVEKFPNLQQEKEDRNKELRHKDRAAQQARTWEPGHKARADERLQQKEELRLARERKELAHQRDHAYDAWNDEAAIAESSNQNGFDEDDFM